MDIQFEIDKNGDNPVYRQIIERIASLIRSGDLRPGDRLPAERDLAEALGIARGTVNRAYEELARSQFLESIPGRGSFVSAKQDVAEPSRKAAAMELIGGLIAKLRELRFSHREIRLLVELSVLEREALFDELAIAVVDCNPETLTVFERQLNMLTLRPPTAFLLDELAAAGDAGKRLSPFPLILTSARHYSELLGLAPALKDAIVQVALSPSQATIIALASIKSSQRLGIIRRSTQFAAIIRAKLRDLMIDDAVPELPIDNISSLPEFLADKDTVIVPPSWAAPTGRDNAGALQNFTERGGRWIVFDYQVERGSMIHVEERVRDLLSP